MPLRDVVRINTKLSNYFYEYGKACASRVTLLLVGSLCAICFLSLPAIVHFTQTVYNNAIPISFALDTFDGQFWLFSPHVQQHPPDFSYSDTPAPVHDIIIKQVRLTNLLQQVDKSLLVYAYHLQQKITTTTIQWKQKQVMSLDSICHHHQLNLKTDRHCLVHSPLVHWKSLEELIEDTDWLGTVNHQMGKSRQQPRINSSPSYGYSINGSNIITTPLSPIISADGLSMQPLSLFGNVTLDLHGNVVSADSIILTFFLQPDPYSTNTASTLKDDINVAWNALWDEVAFKINMKSSSNLHTNDNDDDYSNNINDVQSTTAWYQQANVNSQTWYYKYKLLPLELSSQVQLAIVSCLVLFYVVSTTFAKSTQVKSHYLFGFAALFLSTASCTTTLGILHHFGVELTVVPWYLYYIVCGVACLENVFLMTSAVLYSGCDMQVKEKIARGLQSVGVPMTAMLFAEILILSIGSAMDSVLVQEFCLFGKVALLVDYALEFTFFIAVLSIDVKRVELADLDDRQMSKRLHELSNCDIDAQQNPDFCPIHDNTAADMEPKTCADCKEFKTHRAVNAVLLCVVILGLCLFRQPYPSSTPSTSTRLTANTLPSLLIPRPSDNEMAGAANQFWNVINPSHDVWKIDILPPHLIVQNHPSLNADFDQSSSNFVQSILQQTDIHYIAKDRHYSSNANLIRSSKNPPPPSLFRSFIYRVFYILISWLLSVNIPFLLLCFMSTVVTMWLMPELRRRWVVPAIKHVAIRIKLKLTSIIRGLLAGPSTSSSAEYDANGVHFGAISAQEQFNEQHKSSISSVEVKTLMGKHAADLRLLGANGKHGTVISCDQDGRIVLWDAVQSSWMARLDRLEATTSNGGALLGDLNPEYYSQPRRIKKWQRAFGAYQHEQLQQHHRHRSSFANVIPGCVKTDQGNRWVIAAYDDGSIRVWNVVTGTLACQMDVQDDLSRPALIDRDNNVAIYDTKHHQQQQQPSHFVQNLRQRRTTSGSISSTGQTQSYTSSSSWRTSSESISQHSGNTNNGNSTGTKKSGKNKTVDRILAVQFIGVVAEYCHPLVAEIAAQQYTAAGQSLDPNTSQNYLVSVHKSGMIREWDLFSGECIQSLPSGHVREITYLHSVECKAPHRKLGVTWVFTASKDGCVKCWERRLVKEPSRTSPGVATEGAQPTNDGRNNGSNGTSGSSSSSTNWTCLYSIDAHTGQSITSLATALPIGGMGILVTGTNQGSVKVWNFETGELVGTLSHGISVKPMVNKKTRLQYAPFKQQPSSQQQHQVCNHMAGVTKIVVTRYCDVDTGPELCRGCDTCFGNGFFVASTALDDTAHVWRLERSGGGHEHNCNLCSKDYHRQQYRRKKANTPSTSASGEDELAMKPNGGSHRRQPYQQRQRKMSTSSTSSSNTSSTTNLTATSSAAVSTNATSTTSATTATRRIRRHRPNMRLATVPSTMEDMMNGLLDIEQLADNGEIDLVSVFLGKVHHVAGQSLVFCDNMVLAGVRKKTTTAQQGSKHLSKYKSTTNYKMTEWETWFASLQYYEPPTNLTDSTEIPTDNHHHDSHNNSSNSNSNNSGSRNDLYLKHQEIPIEVYDLDSVSSHIPSEDSSDIATSTTAASSQQSNTTTPSSTWRRLFSWGRSVSYRKPSSALGNNKATNVTNNVDDDDDDDDSYSDDDDDAYVTNMIDDDDLDAKEMLPFSAIHHVVSMDGLGFACDYGNYIKVVCLDNKKLAALRRQQQQQQQNLLEDQPISSTSNLYQMDTWSDGFSNTSNTNNTGVSVNDLHSTSSSSLKNKASRHQCADNGLTGDLCKCKKDGSKCCGGKQLNNGVCCGGVGKSSKGHLLSSVSPSSVTTTTSTGSKNTGGAGVSYDSTQPSSLSCHVRPMAECPAKATCSRAGECHIISSKSSWV